MEFRILGPLEVDDGGRIVPLHGSKQRALLALLLLNAGEVVSDDRLLDELWGSEPPKSGRAALRVRLSELRKTLDGGRERDSPIVTRAPGYLIRVEPDQIDARRFERLLHEGSATLRAGAAEAAASALGEALALWRGPALADFAYESFARAEEARLEELRLTAREELLEAELALGRRAELVAELEALIEAEPLRERPRAQLMLALYRSGRAADALAAYRDARRVFNELGLEPSPRLADLERAILRHDPSLEHRAGSVPRHLGRDWREVKLATIVACALEPAHEAAAQVVARELEEAGGRVETLGGDSVVSIFGAPVAQEDHAWHALAALAAVRARAEGANVRAGVATGEIAVGGGSPLHGTALETARRLCEAAAPGAVLVAERTAAAIGTAVELGAPLTLDAGGEVALVARPLAAPSPPGVRAAVVTPFVGRTRELEALQAAYGRAVATGRPQLATIVGDAGVGKSRLARELWEWLADTSPPPLRQIGRCRQFGRGATYQPLAEVLRDRLRLRETDDADAVRAALGERQILGLTLGLEVAGLHPMTAREQLHTAWVRLLHELVAEQPVVLLLEDFHWAQQPLLDLVERFLAEVSGALTILATARPELLEARPSWGRRWDAETIWLEPLAGDDAARMLALLGGAELPNALRARLLERAEGNPFFLEELVSLLTALAREDGGELVPDTVQAVLAARLDLLPDVERAALQAASVIGRVFWPGPVCELVGVHPDLALLEARDFIRRRPTSSLEGEQAYAFKHALTCDVAYASLARTERVRLHASFAAWLERFGGGRDEHAPLLAHHYAEAVGSGHDDPAWADRPTEYQQTRRSALAWLRRAAQLAVARYEIDDGIALLEHALELESVARARVDLWRALARTYALKYDGRSLLEHYAARHQAVHRPAHARRALRRTRVRDVEPGWNVAPAPGPRPRRRLDRAGAGARGPRERGAASRPARALLLESGGCGRRAARGRGDRRAPR